jgi:hypothetical protein
LASPRQERERLNSVERGSLTSRFFEAKPPNKALKRLKLFFKPSRGVGQPLTNPPMVKFAQFFDMMKYWNAGPGVEEAMTFRLRDAIRNTQHESGELRILCNHSHFHMEPIEWTRMDTNGHE